MNILIIDDEPGLRKGLSKILTLKGYNVSEAETCKEARKIIDEKIINLVLLDLKLKNEDGYNFLKELKENEPLLPVIIITAYGNIKNAVQCLKAGAINYITKPIDSELLLPIIEKEIESSEIRKENISLRESIGITNKTELFKSKSPRMKKINFIIERVKDSPATIMILGESGTGKELTARRIHYSGVYRTKPFIGINCAAINDNLLESELFGHEKGSFTGAMSKKLGRFELARDGSLFLDEIGDMSLNMQAKLLRVIEERTFERVGGTKSIPVSCRIISASNKDIEKLIRLGKFREDLFYRLNLITIKLPPLRERKEDIQDFISFFIGQANKEYNRNIKGVSNSVMDKLMKYDWPGNIRQLKNIITNAVILNRGEIIENIDTFPTANSFDSENILDYKNGLKTTVSKYIEKIEKEIILRAIQENGLNFTKLAEALKITRKTLYEKIRKYKLI